MPQSILSINAHVYKTLYTNPNSGWSVHVAKCEDYGNLRIVGAVYLKENKDYTLRGGFETNKQYGSQFHAYDAFEISRKKETAQPLELFNYDYPPLPVEEINIDCKVLNIRYRNERDGYTALSLESIKTGEVLMANGKIISVEIGKEYEMTGYWTSTKYGNQIKIENLTPLLPKSRNGLIRFLSGEDFPGVGVATANKLYKQYGEQTSDILSNHIEEIRRLPFITEKIYKSLVTGWNKEKVERDTMIFLQGLDISETFAKKIYEKYRRNTIDILKDNPYILMKDIKGIGFLKADEIAANMGISKDNKERIKNGVLYTFDQQTQNFGHVFLYEKQAVTAAKELLDVSEDLIKEQIENLILDEKLVELPTEGKDGRILYPVSLYNAEIDVAEKLQAICETRGRNYDFLQIPKSLGKIVFDEEQINSVKVAEESKVMVLTGGPGTGKTTTLRLILNMFKTAGATILLASPTGKAAQKMTESAGRYIGVEAKTIHRLLQIDPDTGKFVYNEKKHLSGDLLVLDECSMIDVSLMSSLLKALPDSIRLIMVGDADQLPSVGPGNVLKDIINSKVVKVVCLKQIHRQEGMSNIILNAHRINEGKFPILDNSASSDFFFLENNNYDNVAQEIVDLVASRLPAWYHINSRDIQVLCPMKKSNNGVDNLNKLLQDRLNNNVRVMRHGETTYKVGDKVMQLVNDYKKDTVEGVVKKKKNKDRKPKGVFNGDSGYIEDMNVPDHKMIVNFGKGNYEYSQDDLDELSLAYASTIHKSQGSEYPIVVIPLTMQFYRMLQRNLLYTAVTRAKKVCVIVGQKKALEMAVKNNTIQKRNSLLKERLRMEMAPF